MTMLFSQKFLTSFPIQNPNWSSLIAKHIDENELHYTKLYSTLEPCLSQILPSKDLIFRSLNYVNPNNTRVVIIGQDPYPTPGEACGLCFATSNGKIPGSLRNIFREIQADCGGELRKNSDLTDWAQQGILLLNTSLTVLEHQAGIHSKIGWQLLTKFILNTIIQNDSRTIFLLWGKHAHELIPQQGDRFLRCGHPSPLAYGKGGNNFKGCGHFKKTNEMLVSFGLLPIQWHQPDELLSFIVK